MKIFNVFRLDNMPSQQQQQNKLVETVFKISNMHIHDERGYYLVRCTEIDSASPVIVTKLDPNKDNELIDELMRIYMENKEKLT